MKNVLKAVGTFTLLLVIYQLTTVLPFSFTMNFALAYFIGFTLCAAIFTVMLLISSKHKKKNVMISLSPKFLIAILLMIVTTYFVGNYGIASLLSQLLPSQKRELANYFAFTNLDTIRLILFLTVTCVIGPYVEETMFRKFTYEALKEVVPVWSAIILQALLFGTLHMNVIQGTYALLVGLVLGIIYARTNRLWLVVLLHVLCNSCSAMINLLWPRLSDDRIRLFDSTQKLILGVTLVLCIFVFVFAYRIFRAYWKNSQNYTAKR